MLCSCLVAAQPHTVAAVHCRTPARTGSEWRVRGFQSRSKKGAVLNEALASLTHAPPEQSTPNYCALQVAHIHFRPHACTRKKQADERMERTRRQRELLVRQEELRREAQLIQYQQRSVAKKRPLTADELARSAGYRRRKLWLTTVSFARVTAAWGTAFVRMKQLVLVATLRNHAAGTIQRMWRKWKWRHASKHTVIIYTWLRRCLWRLLFNVRCRRRARCASVLQRFMVDQFSGSREMRNFNHLMVQWRNKVISSQRLSKYVVCGCGFCGF